jgi:hypothetical protein
LINGQPINPEGGALSLGHEPENRSRKKRMDVVRIARVELFLLNLPGDGSIQSPRVQVDIA